MSNQIFKVVQGDQEIAVLGTQFNVKAYQDEAITYTTLVEGRVSLKSKDEKYDLRPAEQSQFDQYSARTTIQTVDIFNEIAWRNGVFSFKDMTLFDIMKVLSRWYDANITFQNDEVKNQTFTGILGREQRIEDILHTINSTNKIEYEINQNTITFK